MKPSCAISSAPWACSAPSWSCVGALLLVFGGCPSEEFVVDGGVAADAGAARQPACNHEGEGDEERFRQFRDAEATACDAAQRAKCELPCNGPTCLSESLPRCAFSVCDTRSVSEVRETALGWWCVAGTVYCTEDGFIESDSVCFLPQPSGGTQ